MKTVSVVGVGGVGMAHVVAAARSGHQIHSIIDSDMRILEAARRRWHNEWMNITEGADTQPEAIYLTGISVLDRVSVPDLLIIATPPHTHQEVLLRATGLGIPQIIVEKPCSYPDTPSLLRFPRLVTISSEWAYHSELAQIELPIVIMEMSFPESHHTSWGYEMPLCFDYFPHMFSILEVLGQSVVVDGFGELKRSGIIETKAGGVKLVVRRNEPYGFWINGKELEWQNSLFDRQIACGKGVFSWRQEAILERMLHQSLL